MAKANTNVQNITKSEVDTAIQMLRTMYKSYKSSLDYMAENGKEDGVQFNQNRMSDCKRIASLLMRIDTVDDGLDNLFD